MLRTAYNHGAGLPAGAAWLLGNRYTVAVVVALLHMFVASNATRADALTQKAPPALTLELNTVQQQASACRIAFVMHNRLATAIEKLVFELVVFDKNKRVARILAIDIGALPKGKTRVRQFDLTGMRCDKIGRLLLNDIKHCAGPGLSAALCLSRTQTSSRLDRPFDL